MRRQADGEAGVVWHVERVGDALPALECGDLGAFAVDEAGDFALVHAADEGGEAGLADAVAAVGDAEEWAGSTVAAGLQDFGPLPLVVG